MKDAIRNRSCGFRTPAIVTIALLTLGIGACEQKTDTQAAPAKGTPPTVYTTFYPTSYFTERIAGGHAHVVNPCPPDADPAHWMPNDKTLASYQAADLIVINGAEFEQWVAKASLPMAKVIDSTKPLTDELITLADHVRHSHGPQGQHTHAGIDGHTWLDPINAKKQAAQIKAALLKACPDQAAAIEGNFAGLAADLDQLDARLKAVSKKIGDRPMIASHPVWNYLARRYGWTLKTLHLDPEQVPNDKTIAQIKAYLSEQPAHVILWEAQPASEIERRFREEFGLTSVVYAPGEAIDAEALKAGQDFLTIMNANVDGLVEVFD